jgi:hypothetical protein
MSVVPPKGVNLAKVKVVRSMPERTSKFGMVLIRAGNTTVDREMGACDQLADNTPSAGCPATRYSLAGRRPLTRGRRVDDCDDATMASPRALGSSIIGKARRGAHSAARLVLCHRMIGTSSVMKVLMAPR